MVLTMTDLGTEGLEANGANRVADIAKMSVPMVLASYAAFVFELIAHWLFVFWNP